MDVKELTKLIREFVKKEIAYHKQDLIKEIKAELFDVIMSSNKPIQVAQSVNEEVLPKKSMDKTQLRNIFESSMSGGESVVASTKSVPINTIEDLPASFDGNLVPEKHKEVLEAINKDYSGLMKAMGV